MYMCVKLPLRDLNAGPYPPHPISVYTYGVTITPKMCGGNKIVNFNYFNYCPIIN